MKMLSILSLALAWGTLNGASTHLLAQQTSDQSDRQPSNQQQFDARQQPGSTNQRFNQGTQPYNQSTPSQQARGDEQRRSDEGGQTRRQRWNDDSSDTWTEWFADWWNNDQQRRRDRLGVRERNQSNARNQSSTRASGDDRAQSQDIASAANDLIAQYDQNNDQMLLQDELPPRWHAVFDRIDADGDSRISRSELQQYAQRTRHRGVTPIELTYVWVIDADRGRSDLNELQKAYAMLRKIDKDGDGVISRQELMDRREQVVSNWCDQCFDRLDTDGDGQLSSSEAEGSTFGEAFDEIDQNQDSQLTKSEIHRYMSRQFDSAGDRQQQDHQQQDRQQQARQQQDRQQQDRR